jgi:hypothetical protein
LTTIGVFLIGAMYSKDFAKASLEDCSPMIISTNGILSTGEKKCIPIKL